MILSNKDFLEKTLHFEENKIFFIDDNNMHFVMTTDENSLMNRTCDLLVNENDDLLEIGFGMGIFSDYAQSKNIKSHTIVEGHPQVYQKLLEWSKDKSNVIPIFGDWLSVLPEILNRNYDSVYFDTHYDSNEFKFLHSIHQNIRVNGRYSKYLLEFEDNSFLKKETMNTNFEIFKTEYHDVTLTVWQSDQKTFKLPICILIKK
jgi:protein arginine N-methyltransferase 2